MLKQQIITVDQNLDPRSIEALLILFPPKASGYATWDFCEDILSLKRLHIIAKNYLYVPVSRDTSWGVSEA